MQTNQKQSVYYKYSYSDDLFFLAIPISSENKNFWREYFDAAPSSQAAVKAKEVLGQNKQSKAYSVLRQIPNGQAGVRIFKQDPDNNDPLEQWIILASQINITDPHNIPLDKLEMTMMVTTSLHANFTAHMGISRTYDSLLMEVTHPQISMPIHAFSAAVTLLHYGSTKDHVKCSPVHTMREAFKKSLNAETLDKYLVTTEETSTCMQHVWFKKFGMLSHSKSLMQFQLSELSEFLPRKLNIESISI